VDLHPAFSASGFVTGKDGVKPPPGISLVLQGNDSGINRTTIVPPDGTFQFVDLGPDDYSVSASDASGRVFVVALFIDDRPATGASVTISGPNHSLRVIISDSAATIRGRAVTSDQIPASTGIVVLVHVAESGELRAQAVALEASGTFAFRSLPPGKYRILCFSDLTHADDATWDVQRTVIRVGDEVSLADGDTRELTIRTTQLEPIQ
jgi:hypothetical protein